MQSHATFRRMMEFVAERLGGHQVPVRRGAREIREFLLPEAVHDELLKRLVTRLYRANRCGHLDATVDWEVTLDALGEIRIELLRLPRTDIDQFEFIESFCAGAAAYFADQQTSRKVLGRERGASAPQAKIIPLQRNTLKVS
jgi:hypothetical protein